MQHITVPSFQEIKGRSSARKRIAFAIRGTLETSEEGSSEIDLIQVTNDTESTFCQPCTKYRTEVDWRLTEIDELIKTQNICREQADQLISHIEIFTGNLQNLENNVEPVKTKANCIDMYPGIKKMFKSARRLDSNYFLVIFKFLNTGPHSENTKFYDNQVLKNIPRM